MVMLSLAVYYSVYESQLVGTFNPKGDLEAYRAKIIEHPSLKCDCEVQTVPFNQFSVATFEVNRACDWVEADLVAEVSSCRSLRLVGYCASVRDACRQSRSTLDWVMNEFNKSVVSSTTLIQEASLAENTEASFMSNFKIGQLIASSPKFTVRAWAAANMPRIMKMTGDLALRVQALTKQHNADPSWLSDCDNAHPIVCTGSDPDDDDYALFNGGDVPVNCTLDTSVTCGSASTSVANGVCEPQCMSPECFFDGGDCADAAINSDPPRDLRQSFSILDALLSSPSQTSWLDSMATDYIDTSRSRCDDAERWSRTEVLPESQDIARSKFAGYSFSSLADVLLNLNTSNAGYPRAPDGVTPVEFRAAKILGCDQYEKELKENLFEFYSVTDFKYFMQQMRTLTGADYGDSPSPGSSSPGSPPSSSSSSSIPIEWSCDPGYYAAADGCDCACGAWDPDCDDPSMSTYNCPNFDDVCTNINGGTCASDYGSTPSMGRRRLAQASGWSCDPGYYAADDGCDCACGAWDPDCDNPTVALYNCNGDNTEYQCVQQPNGGAGLCQVISAQEQEAQREALAAVFVDMFNASNDEYKKTGFDFLENFAASLSQKHTNLETAIENLLVDRSSVSVNYTKYFTACRVTSCTYTYMSASSVSGVAAVIIGLLGGINNAMNASFQFAYSVLRKMVVPKPDCEEPRDEDVETPATEGEGTGTKESSPV